MVTILKDFLKNNRIIVIAIAVVLAIGICVGGYFIISQANQDESVGTSTTQKKTKKESTTSDGSTETPSETENEENPGEFNDLSHLSRHAPNMYISWQHNETEYDAVTIDWKCTEDAWGTYWAVHEWENGYAGFQNILNSHVLIFSLWDLPDGTRPTVDFSLTDSHGDFGGEGEGKKVYTKYDWKVDTWYSMKIERVYEEGKTYFSQYIKEEDGEWLKTATISYPVRYSFLPVSHFFQEDFLFNNLRRSCEVKNAGGLVAGTGTWVQWTQADISNSFFPTDEATWEDGVMLDVSFNCDYRCDGNSIWVQSGGYDNTPNHKLYPATVTIK